jgi:hypothetical protein
MECTDIDPFEYCITPTPDLIIAFHSVLKMIAARVDQLSMKKTRTQKWSERGSMTSVSDNSRVIDLEFVMTSMKRSYTLASRRSYRFNVPALTM